MEINIINGGSGREWSRQFANLIASIFTRSCYLQYTNFPSLGDEESVILNIVLPIHASGKDGKNKTESCNTRLTGLLVP